MWDANDFIGGIGTADAPRSLVSARTVGTYENGDPGADLASATQWRWSRTAARTVGVYDAGDPDVDTVQMWEPRYNPVAQGGVTGPSDGLTAGQVALAAVGIAAIGLVAWQFGR